MIGFKELSAPSLQPSPSQRRPPPPSPLVVEVNSGDLAAIIDIEEAHENRRRNVILFHFHLVYTGTLQEEPAAATAICDPFKERP